MKITIYGSERCFRCDNLFNAIKELIKEFGLDVEIEKENDPGEAVKKGIMGFPAMAVDGEVKVKGRVPTKEEIKEILNV